MREGCTGNASTTLEGSAAGWDSRRGRRRPLAMTGPAGWSLSKPPGAVETWLTGISSRDLVLRDFRLLEQVPEEADLQGLISVEWNGSRTRAPAACTAPCRSALSYGDFNDSVAPRLFGRLQVDRETSLDR